MAKGVITVKNKYDENDIKTINKKDVRWAGNTIRGFIKNPMYKGVRVFAGKEYECPAILDAEYWQQANDNLKKNANNSGKKVDHNI